MEIEGINVEEIKSEITLKKKYKNERHFLKDVSKKLNDRLELFRDILEEVLNPDISDLAINYEIRLIKFDIEEIWKAYKKIIKAIRMYDLCLVKNDNETYKEFINYALKVIKETKEVVTKIIEEKMKLWDKEIEYKRPKEYLG